jgi:hypothetical protein
MRVRRDRPAVELPPAVARKRLIRRLTPLVLLGLWLMHGISATSGAGCHGVPLMMPMSASVSDALSMPTTMSASTIVRHSMDVTSVTRSASVQVGSGELCLSGQPPTPGHFLLALLAALAMLGLVLLANLLQRLSGEACEVRRRGPPGSAGRKLLTTVCVSRT